MSSFDHELWRRRAERKHQKSASCQINDHSLNADLRAIDRLSKVVEWCSKHGIEVVFCRRIGGLYVGEKNMIRISDQLAPHLQVHFLLHECGHSLINIDNGGRYSHGWPMSEDPVASKTLLHRIDIVDEELEAWYRGWRLAKRLRLGLNKIDYDKTRVRMIRTYLAWALKSKGYEGKIVDPDGDKIV